MWRKYALVSNLWYTAIAIAVFLLQATHFAAGQASLAAEDTVDDIKVDVRGAADTYTLIRDGRLVDQWYYIPNRPCLAETNIQGRVEPEFTMLRYQFKDSANAEKLLEAGIINFAAALAAPPEALAQMKAALAAKKNIDVSKLRLAALPLKSSEVAIYTPSVPGEKSSLLTDAPQGAGIAPIFANQKMAFSLSVSRIGSDVMDAIVRGNTGIPIAVTYTYLGLTPPAGVRVEVDWDTTFRHFSSDERFRVSGSYHGWFGASYESSSQKIREELLARKCIKVTGITGEAFDAAELDKVLQPLLARINAELLESFKAPATINPAQATRPRAGGYYGGAGYSIAKKDVQIKKKGKETFDFSIQSVAERKTVASGFIGIGAYPKEVQDRLTTTVPDGPFKSAYLALPPAAGLEELGIQQADLEVGLKKGNTGSKLELVTWKPGAGWTSQGVPRSAVVIPLLGTGVTDPDFKATKLEATLKLTTPLQYLATTQVLDAFDGQRAMQAINQSSFDVVEVDGSNLTFRQIDPRSKLVSVNVTLRTHEEHLTQPLRLANDNGVRKPPSPLRWLIKRAPGKAEPAPVWANIKFVLSDGTSVDWVNNGKALRDLPGGLEIYLDDTMYSK